MRSVRKVNIIRALKDEIIFYKKQLDPINMHDRLDRTELKHLRLSAEFSLHEVEQMPKDVLSPLLIHKIVESFKNTIMYLPMETEYDERFDIYKAILDLWVKPKVR